MTLCLGRGPGARLPLVLLDCFYGFMKEEWAAGEMVKLSIEQVYVSEDVDLIRYVASNHLASGRLMFCFVLILDLVAAKSKDNC